MKLKDFTINALKTVGLTDADLAEIASATNTDEIELSDDLINRFNSGILTLDSAKANTNLKSHFNAQVYNGIDALLGRLAEENNIDSLSKYDFDSEKSTPKKMELLVKAINKKVASSATPANVDEIRILNEQLLKLKQDSEIAIKNKDTEFENTLIQMERQNYLATKDYANITDKEIGIKIASEYLNKALSEKGATLVRENGKLKLKSSKDLTLDYYENNKAVSYNEFTDGVLAQNNLLKVNNQTQAPAATQRTITTTTGGDVNHSVLDRNKAQLEQFKNASINT